MSTEYALSRYETYLRAFGTALQRQPVDLSKVERGQLHATIRGIADGVRAAQGDEAGKFPSLPKSPEIFAISCYESSTRPIRQSVEWAIEAQRRADADPSDENKARAVKMMERLDIAVDRIDNPFLTSQKNAEEWAAARARETAAQAEKIAADVMRCIQEQDPRPLITLLEAEAVSPVSA